MSPDWEDDKPRSDDPFTSPFGEDAPASDEPAPPEEDERFEWRLRDEEEEQQPQPPLEEEGGTPEGPYEWPTPTPYTTRSPYGEQAPTPYWDRERPPSVPGHRSRDPLARLFPGLPRSVRVTLDFPPISHVTRRGRRSATARSKASSSRAGSGSCASRSRASAAGRPWRRGRGPRPSARAGGSWRRG